MTHTTEPRDHNGRTEAQRKMLARHATERRNVNTLTSIDREACLANLIERQDAEYTATLDSVQLIERQIADHRRQSKREHAEAKASIGSLAHKHYIRFCELQTQLANAKKERDNA